MDRLKELQQKHQIIGDVRGRGLMIGIELVKDRVTKERAVAERDKVVDACFTRGLLVLGAGKNSIRLSPPLVLTKAQAETAVKIIDQAMQTFGAMGVTKELPLHLMAQKVRVMRVYEGPSEVHRMAIARHILRRAK